MFKRADLRGAGGGVHLLAQPRDLASPVGHVGLLRAAQDLFLGERLLCRGERKLSLAASSFSGSHASRRFSKLSAQAFQFQILRLENDEMFEIGVHRAPFEQFQSKEKG